MRDERPDNQDAAPDSAQPGSVKSSGEGWVCPSCGRVNSDVETSCYHCGQDPLADFKRDSSSAVSHENTPDGDHKDAQNARAPRGFKTKQGRQASGGKGSKAPPPRGDSVFPSARAREVSLVGFSSSGKTVYLSMLYHAFMEGIGFSDWSADWTGDGGKTASYLRERVAEMEGRDKQDGKPRYLVREDGSVDFDRLKRTLPEGTTQETELTFKLNRALGLGQVGLHVRTMDIEGELLQRLVSSQLIAGDAERIERVLDHCRSSRVVLIMINLVGLDSSNVAADSALLTSLLFSRPHRIQAVGFIITGVDILHPDALKERKRELQRKLQAAVKTLQNEHIACECFMVSSFGWNTTRKQRVPNHPECRQDGHYCARCLELRPERSVRFNPYNIEAPWNFIFHIVQPWWGRSPALVTGRDALRRFSNLVFSRIAALVAIGLMAAWAAHAYMQHELRLHDAVEAGWYVLGGAGAQEERIAEYGRWHGWRNRAGWVEWRARLGRMRRVEALGHQLQALEMSAMDDHALLNEIREFHAEHSTDQLVAELHERARERREESARLNRSQNRDRHLRALADVELWTGIEPEVVSRAVRFVESHADWVPVVDVADAVSRLRTRSEAYQREQASTRRQREFERLVGALGSLSPWGGVEPSILTEATRFLEDHAGWPPAQELTTRLMSLRRQNELYQMRQLELARSARLRELISAVREVSPFGTPDPEILGEAKTFRDQHSEWEMIHELDAAMDAAQGRQAWWAWMQARSRNDQESSLWAFEVEAQILSRLVPEHLSEVERSALEHDLRRMSEEMAAWCRSLSADAREWELRRIELTLDSLGELKRKLTGISDRFSLNPPLLPLDEFHRSIEELTVLAEQHRVTGGGG